MSIGFDPGLKAPITPDVQRPGESRAPGKAGDAGFANMLADSIEQARGAEQAAETKAQEFAAGEAGIHETVLAQERAGIAVRFAVTVKNRAVEAYREIMRTQI